MAGYEIRRASEKEAEAIAGILREAFQEFRSLYTVEAFHATTPMAQEVFDRMSDGPVWIAVLDGRIVGTVSAVPKGKSLYVRSMAVHPSVRGKGIARALLLHVEAFAKQGEYESLLLSTTPFLAAAISLYEHFGFYRCDAGPQDLYGTTLFTMVKRIL